MNRKCFVAVLSMSILLIGEMCYANIIYLKNGQRMEGTTKEVANGVYVDGMLFTNDEIERIQVVPTAEKEDKDRTTLYEKLLNRFGVRSERQIQVEEERKKEAQKEQMELDRFKARMARNKEAMYELDRLYDKERERARQNNANVLNKARQVTKESRSKERQKVKEMQKEGKGFFKKEISRSKQRGDPGWDNDSSSDVWEPTDGEDTAASSSGDYDDALSYDEEEWEQLYGQEEAMGMPSMEGLGADVEEMMKSVQEMFGQLF